MRRREVKNGGEETVPVIIIDEATGADGDRPGQKGGKGGT